MRTPARWVRAEILVCFITSSHQTATKIHRKRITSFYVRRNAFGHWFWLDTKLNRWKMRHGGHWPNSKRFHFRRCSTLFMVKPFFLFFSLFLFSSDFLRRWKFLLKKMEEKHNWMKISIENTCRLLTRWTFIDETLSETSVAIDRFQATSFHTRECTDWHGQMRIYVFAQRIEITITSIKLGVFFERARWSYIKFNGASLSCKSARHR